MKSAENLTPLGHRTFYSLISISIEQEERNGSIKLNFLYFDKNWNTLESEKTSRQQQSNLCYYHSQYNGKRQLQGNEKFCASYNIMHLVILRKIFV